VLNMDAQPASIVDQYVSHWLLYPVREPVYVTASHASVEVREILQSREFDNNELGYPGGVTTPQVKRGLPLGTTRTSQCASWGWGPPLGEAATV